MKVSDRVVILGDGESAVMVANKIVQKAARGDVEVIVVGKNKRLEFSDSNIFVPVSLIDQGSSRRNLDSLLRMNVTFIRDEPVSLNLKDNIVNTKGGKIIRYDHIILTDYMRPDPSKIVGYNEDARSIETLEGAMSLKEDLSNFKKGDIVIYHDNTSLFNPLNSVNLAINIFNYFQSKGNGNDIKINCVFSSELISGNKELDGIIESTLKSMGIELTKGFKLTGFNVKNKELQSSDGKAIKYDIPVIFSPSSYSSYVESANFPKADSGNIEVNMKDLTLKGFDNVFIMGYEGTSFTNYWKVNRGQADFISSRIAFMVSGYPEPDHYVYTYDSVMIKGKELASSIISSLDGKLVEGRPSRTDYLVALYSHEAFFGTYALGFI